MNKNWQKDDSFLKSFGKVLGSEGGFVDDPYDSGGRTIYGISESANPDAWEDGKPTLDEAASIYYTRYWKPAGCHRLDHPSVRHEAFDTAILMGPKTSVKMMQRAINLLRKNPIAVDGIFGTRTATVINKYHDPKAVAGYMAVIQGERIIDIIKNNPSQRRFARGWLKRIEFNYS